MINNMLTFIKKLIPNAIKDWLKRSSIRSFHWFLFDKKNITIRNMRKLNIGSGTSRKVGFINIDIDESTKPDILRNIEKGMPFDDSSVDEIICSHTLEHIHDLLFVLREFYRVCKHGALITITIPLMDPSDMTHVRFFNKDTFRTLTDPYYWEQPYYFVGKYKEVSKSFRDLATCEEMTIVLEVIKP